MQENTTGEMSDIIVDEGSKPCTGLEAVVGWLKQSQLRLYPDKAAVTGWGSLSSCSLGVMKLTWGSPLP